MGNKLSASPIPSYEAAVALFNASEWNELKAKFLKMSGNQENLFVQNFVKVGRVMLTASL